ncbi:MAG: hypothetical protein CSB16_00050 [Clostridiales bacterium]|nr:MAG: hypothetical protein CSB16_00050 [Clostridiales bacterium]
MKYKFLILFVVLLILTSCGKLSNPLISPNSNELKEIEISKIDKGKVVESKFYRDSKNIAEIIDCLSDSEPTTIKSINDFPDNDEVIQVDFVLDGDKSTFFVYKERKFLRDKYYVESPYQGVWEMDEDVYKKLQNF